jgi:hypothetical protein
MVTALYNPRKQEPIRAKYVYTNYTILITNFKVCEIQHRDATYMILTTVKITANQQSCIFYTLRCSHCTADNIYAKAGVFLGKKEVKFSLKME